MRDGQIRITVEVLSGDGEVISHEIVQTKEIKKPKSAFEVGFRHSEQISLIQSIQQLLLNAQAPLLNSDLSSCAKCGSKLHKSGTVKSDLYSVFTDHKVAIGRKVCKSCKWTITPSIRSIFGSASHPDLIKIQSELGSKHTFRESADLLNLLSNTERPVNNHDKIKRVTEAVGHDISTNPIEPQQGIEPSAELCVQVDGGHVSTVEENKRSFEAMTSIVFDPKNISHEGGKLTSTGKITQTRGVLTSKHCAASALSDNGKTINAQTLNAAIKQGMTKHTKMTAICDGAKNCWSVIDNLENYSYSIERVLDWHHVAMKFQNSRLGDESLNEKLMSAKWHLWHGDSTSAITKLDDLLVSCKDDEKKVEKLTKLQTYIKNNANYIPDYRQKQDDGEIFTSQLAECTVESLINKRCKGQQHMRWSREGLHALLQVRAAVNSGDWNDICERHIESAMYKDAA
tara:strand:- start:2696 stop:4066 length:1371 start_codon:yes stop_codon:yes gene_type:complete